MHTCTHTCTQADTDPDGLNELALFDVALFDADGDGMLDGGAEQEAARAAYREASKARRAKVAQALAEENKALEEERERMRLTGTTARSSSYLLMYLHTY